MFESGFCQMAGLVFAFVHDQIGLYSFPIRSWDAEKEEEILHNTFGKIS